MKGGRYRPMYYHTLKAGLDAQGKLVAWQHRIVGQSILAGTPFESMMVKNSVDQTSVEGASNLPYAVPNILVDLVTTDVKVPVLWWRAVGSTHTAYSTEVVHRRAGGGRGPGPGRVPPRAAAGPPAPSRRAGPRGREGGLGHAAAGRAASAASRCTSCSAPTSPRSPRSRSGTTAASRSSAWSARSTAACAVNPDIIRAQMEGGIGFGLGAILKGEITLDGGRVVQDNFDTYRMLTIDEMPKVEVHIVPSTEPPTGVGEPGVPPIGPAVANAVYAATGKRDPGPAVQPARLPDDLSERARRGDGGSFPSSPTVLDGRLGIRDRRVAGSRLLESHHAQMRQSSARPRQRSPSLARCWRRSRLRSWPSKTASGRRAPSPPSPTRRSARSLCSRRPARSSSTRAASTATRPATGRCRATTAIRTCRGRGAARPISASPA